jgi:hypothetical protein
VYNWGGYVDSTFGGALPTYTSNWDCRWLFDSDIFNAVSLSFSTLNLLGEGDRIEVRDGNNISAPLLASYAQETSQTLPPTLFSSQQYMLLRFLTGNATVLPPNSGLIALYARNIGKGGEHDG